MLFNSAEFIAGFLPVALAGWFAFCRVGRAPAMAWLVLASLFFYAWWDPRNLAIIVPSIVVNYLVGAGIARLPRNGARLLVTVGIAANLAALGWFKYWNFIAANLATARGLELGLRHIVLPLGISFFTFQQIKFLVDRYTGAALEQPSFLRYALLVSFFPHVIAGPIVHHDELLPQFDGDKVFRFRPALFADGAAMFLLGLAKKVVLADPLGVFAAEGFYAAAHGGTLTFFAAWGAALAYTLQLYFDFSGYSDMAVGLARMVGVDFPVNFLSPYKAGSIIEFWRRWHITLSRFLRDYLYIPLGGNRHGGPRRYVNLMLTMLLGGLWHGAGWTFVLWGGLHGGYLVVNHGWIRLRQSLGLGPSRAGRAAGHALTLLAVVIAWVFFRAENLGAAIAMLGAMAGGNGSLLPAQLIDLLPLLRHIAEPVGSVPYLAGGSVLGLIELAGLLALGFAIALGAPNLYEIGPRARLLLLVPSAAFALQRVFFSAGASEFLYFRF